MLSTKLCELLNIKYPIIQGGMAWVATHELAAAVSNAGGLGIIGCGNCPPEWIVEQIKATREHTDKPFGLNIMLLSSFAREAMEVAVREKVKVVTTGAGNPGAFLPQLREAGVMAMPVVASVALAQGRGLAAALALGAAGIQMGTRFVCTEECIAHPNFKRKIVDARDRATVVTGTPTGHPVRCLENKLARQFLALEKQGVTSEELQELGSGKFYEGAIEGDVEYGSLMAGQIAGLIKEVRPVSSIIEEIIAEAEAIIAQLADLSRRVSYV